MKLSRRTKNNRRGRGDGVGGSGRCALSHSDHVWGCRDGTAGEGATKPDDLSSSPIRVVQVDN